MRSEIKLAAVGAALLALSGCASLGHGNNKYGCAGMPEGTQCASAREVYEMTETVDRVTSDARHQAAKRHAEDRGPREIGQNLLPAASGAIPIRTPSQVMRIRLNFWEDEAGDLHVPGFVYTEIEKRTWQVGMPAEHSPPVLRPLGAPLSD